MSMATTKNACESLVLHLRSSYFRHNLPMHQQETGPALRAGASRQEAQVNGWRILSREFLSQESIAHPRRHRWAHRPKSRLRGAVGTCVPNQQREEMRTWPLLPSRRVEW